MGGNEVENRKTLFVSYPITGNDSELVVYSCLCNSSMHIDCFKCNCNNYEN